MANLSILSVLDPETGPRLAQPGPLATLLIALCQAIADAGEREVVAFFMMIPVMQHILPRRFLWIAFKYGMAVYLGLLAVGFVAVEVCGA